MHPRLCKVCSARDQAPSVGHFQVVPESNQVNSGAQSIKQAFVGQLLHTRPFAQSVQMNVLTGLGTGVKTHGRFFP